MAPNPGEAIPRNTPPDGKSLGDNKDNKNMVREGGAGGGGGEDGGSSNNNNAGGGGAGSSGASSADTTVAGRRSGEGSIGVKADVSLWSRIRDDLEALRRVGGLEQTSNQCARQCPKHLIL